MAVEFTKEQRQAIESRGGSLIVAAAAGSGKTAVLVERVIRRLLEPEGLYQCRRHGNAPAHRKASAG